MQAQPRWAPMKSISVYVSCITRRGVPRRKFEPPRIRTVTGLWLNALEYAPTRTSLNLFRSVRRLATGGSQMVTGPALLSTTMKLSVSLTS